MYQDFSIDRTFSSLLGPSMIRSNQSATRPRKQQETEITKLHKEIFDKIDALYQEQVKQKQAAQDYEKQIEQNLVDL